MITQKFKMVEGESLADYIFRMYQIKDSEGLTWEDLAVIISNECGQDLTPSAVRNRVLRMNKKYEDKLLNDEPQLSSLETLLLNTKTEKYKLADERTQLNALYRRIAREDTIKEIAHDFAEQMSCNPLPPLQNTRVITTAKKEGTLCISDWHYGIDINNFYNIYNTNIAKQRIKKLQDEVIGIIIKEGLTHLNVLNLGDLIGGRIHLQLRVNSRIDVITQIMEVGELLAEFLHNLSDYVMIDYYSTLDNHSRLEPNMKDSIELESLVRIIDWYLPERLRGDNIVINTNEFSDDIITLKIFGFRVAAVHGHKDKPSKIIDGLSMYTQNHQDLICAAHYHHFSAEEKNETILISNGSLMGTDDFASNLRLNAKPSQVLIVSTDSNILYNLYKINLDNN